MTNAALLFESFVNVKHIILGKELKPFSLFHLLWLYHIQSPLVETNKAATIQDLELAVLICSSSSNEQIFSLLDNKHLARLKRLRLALWRRKNRKRNLETELKKFLVYNDDYISLPEFYSKEGADKNEKLPWILLHISALVKTTGWGLDKVLLMPVGLLVWLNLGLSYLETGETSVVSDREQTAIDLINRSLTLAK
jgi:hypothetical protein